MKHVPVKFFIVIHFLRGEIIFSSLCIRSMDFLPTEMNQSILIYLRFPSLLALRLVSKKFNALVISIVHHSVDFCKLLPGLQMYGLLSINYNVNRYYGSTLQKIYRKWTQRWQNTLMLRQNMDSETRAQFMHLVEKMPLIST